MKPSTAAKLREKAEARLQEDTQSMAALPEADVYKMLHELQVHQIELQMQNEELEEQKDLLCEAIDAESRALHRYTELFDFAPISYFTLEQDSKIAGVNLRGASLLGQQRSKVKGQRLLNYVIPEHRFLFTSFLDNAFSNQTQHPCEVAMQIGEKVIWLTVDAHIGVAKTDCLVAMSDISERKQAAEQLLRFAYYDALTDLPNHVLLAERLNMALIECQRTNCSLAVAYIDLDGYKIVNSTHGRSVGDQLLIRVSQAMQAALGESDTLARIGSDQFIAVLSNLENTDEVEAVFEQLLVAAAEPIMLESDSIKISLSMGVSFYPHDAVHPDILMRHADQAMHVAKRAGKNRYQLFGNTVI